MIPFIDLAAQRKRLGPALENAILEVVRSGQYVMGPQVVELERQLARFGQARHALACGNGTDALALPLMAWDIGAGDAVFCPSFTFAATAEVIPWSGAEPVFVDILPDTYCLDPRHLEAAIEAVKAEGRLTPKAVIAVDLFGQPADYPAIAAVCRRHGLKLIADSAQSFGCTLDGLHPLHWADAATTSFFPAKPLGCYGDGGAVLTNDELTWELVDSLHVHGKATAHDLAEHSFEHEPKYLNVRIGMNSRLDTMQAAVLLQKLTIFEDEIEKRQAIADRYTAGLCDAVVTPTVIDGGRSVWAQYTIETPDRDGLAAALREQGYPTAVYYPAPMHRQEVYAAYAQGPGGLPVTEAKSKVVLSVPMHPYLEESVQDGIVATIRDYVGAQTPLRRAASSRP